MTAIISASRNPKVRERWNHLSDICAITALVTVLSLEPSHAQTIPAVSPLPQLVAIPHNRSGIYELGAKAGWTIVVPADTAVPAGNYSYTVKANNSATLTTGLLDLSSGRALLETTATEPTMLYVQIMPPAAAPTNPAESTPPRGQGRRGGRGGLVLGAAVAPTKLQPSAPRPADFDAFWDGKLQALAQVPINPVLTRGEANKAGVEFYTVQLDSLNSHVQGYLAKPAKEGKFPALVIYQYAGVYALQPSTVTDRAAEGWLTLDVDSHDLPPNQATGVSPGYQAIGNNDRETSYFLNMYLRDSRAIDYIANRADWDGKTIVVMGTSMGGQQSLVTAGLNPKVTAVIVNEPSGADSNGDLHGRTAGYPNWPSGNPKVMETALYFDTVNFASRIKAPAFVAMGFLDTTAPPVGIWIVFNQIPGPKEAIPMIDSDHNNRATPDQQRPYTSRSTELLNLILHGLEFTPQER